MPLAHLADPPMPLARRSSDHALPLPQLDSIAALGLHLSRQLAQCRRTGAQVALLWVELEPLVGPGAAQGWELDDELLRAAGQRLQHRVRGTDEVVQVARLGFAVLLQAASTSEAELVERRLKQALTGAYGLGERRTYLGVGLGVAVFPESARNGTDLAEAARRDLALRHGA